MRIIKGSHVKETQTQRQSFQEKIDLIIFINVYYNMYVRLQMCAWCNRLNRRLVLLMQSHEHTHTHTHGHLLVLL